MSIKQAAKEFLSELLFASPPPLFRGNRAVNKLGLQVARTVYFKLLWNCRRSIPISPENKQYLEAFDRDGVATIPNFLTPEQFTKVREEFLRLSEKPTAQNTNGIVQRGGAVISLDQIHSPLVKELFVDNPTIRQLISTIMRRPINMNPFVNFETSGYSTEEAVRKNLTISSSQQLHEDVPYPTCKAFFYLNDVNESNGAFVYAKGSQKFSKDKLRLGYRLSIRKHEGADYPVPTAEEKKEFKIVETHMTGKANTLILINNMGFHRRGQFTTTNLREVMICDYRALDSWRNDPPFFIKPFIKN